MSRSINNVFNSDFLEFLQTLNNNGVDYLLVGGYSVILHGYHRTTGDMDIWVNPNASNFIHLKQAFGDFGLPTDAIQLDQFLDTANYDVFTFGRPPIAIDILTKVKGLDFNKSKENATVFNSDGVDVQVIHLNDLKLAKIAAGRFKDLDDLENLN